MQLLAFLSVLSVELSEVVMHVSHGAQSNNELLLRNEMSSFVSEIPHRFRAVF